ncbi:uncharacterized protein LOC125493185 [Beta vulgaris subsp. vulgaris]|uniref:uncharacterized protein LOC125493185 n=1 Tax=Beta vulgaris subsp. vulgaris TaxID=3555 RepID=UPI002036ED40|nr:uncharacterized protein LOC125493185 [Beta vulgaris subsp. vulgaris]
MLTRPYTAQEVKLALFSIPGDKSPGPDGYGTHFFRDTWDVLGEEITQAVLEVLHTGKLLTKLNATILTLVSKVRCPSSALKFPEKFVSLVMHCVRTPKFTLMVNGSLHGYFSSQRGLRQGDPISPLLFVICMEYLSRLMKTIEYHPHFKFHPRCKKSKLNHMVFADDIILCCEGSFPSVYTMLKAFKLFSATSGLQIIEQKSDFDTAGVSQEVIQRIKAVTKFAHSKLHFKYLGVPVCARKIRVAECHGIIEKMFARIKVWSSRNLSYMARVTLVNSVLISIHQYWAQMFIMPKTVLKEIEKICRAFLWTGEWSSNKPGNVAWEHVCLPKQAGGVGFGQIQYWNVAALAKYVWAISTKQDNLWVKWVHEVYVKDSRWWDYEPPTDSCWY